MYKYITVIAFAVLISGCQSEQTDQTADQPMADPFQQEQQMAEVDVSDDELQQFIELTVELQEGQMAAQQDMIAIVEEEGLTVETYNQIAQGMQMGQTEEELDVSETDMEKYEAATESIAEIERELDAELEESIADAGMSMDRFQQINMSIQQDQALQQRAQEMMQSIMMQQQESGMGE